MDLCFDDLDVVLVGCLQLLRLGFCCVCVDLFPGRLLIVGFNVDVWWCRAVC